MPWIRVGEKPTSITPVVLQGEKLDKFCDNSFFMSGNIVCDIVPEVPLVQFDLVLIITKGRDQCSKALEKITQDQLFYKFIAFT